MNDGAIMAVSAAMCPPEADYCRERMVDEEAEPFIRALAKEGFVIVPAGDVPTPEERAAVGRLVDWVTARDEYTAAVMEDCRRRGEKQSDRVVEASIRSTKAYEARQPGDIEAAKRVAGGK